MTKTLGDIVKEQKKRDRKLAHDAKRQAMDAAGGVFLDPNKSRLEQIQERGMHHCNSCIKTKLLPLDRFYTVYDTDKKNKKLIKIWPKCKSCMGGDRKKNNSERHKKLVLRCFRKYGKHKHNKDIKCASCNHRTKESLTLIDLRYKTKKCLFTMTKYEWLKEHKFPKMDLKLVCYNCAFEYIHAHSKR